MYLRYKTDVFFSTRTKIILFNVLSIIVTVLVTVALIAYVERTTLAGIVDAFSKAVSDGTPTADVFNNINRQTNNAQLLVYSIIVLTALIVGSVATRLALKPVRETLITQRRFIASVAHELRTPLAVLKTQNEVAKLDVEVNSTVVETLTQNVEEIDHITEILNNLLLFNRVDTLESIVFETVNIEPIIQSIVAGLQPLAERKGVVLSFGVTFIPKVYGNATGLEQMFFNIIKNAINYTSRGGEVRVRVVSITEREVTITIKDNGVGIAGKELPHIFEPFYRIDSLQGMSPGTGLGLAIVFEIIKLHSGKISVDSTLGKGTQFNVSIPRQPQSMAANRHLDEVGIAHDFTHSSRMPRG